MQKNEAGPLRVPLKYTKDLNIISRTIKLRRKRGNLWGTGFDNDPLDVMRKQKKGKNHK